MNSEFPSDLLERVETKENYLVAGPPASSNYEFALEVLAAGLEEGGGAVIISSENSATDIREDLSGRMENFDASRVGVVDCISRQTGTGSEEDEVTEYISSPEDLTGIGISFSELFADQMEKGGPVRIMLNSVSSLLMYSDLERVFRFLHVLTGQVRNAGALGVYLINPGSHNEQEMNTLKPLFSGVVELRFNDEDEEEYRISGSKHGRTKWKEL